MPSTSLEQFIRFSVLKQIFPALEMAKKEEYWYPFPVPDTLKTLDINALYEQWAERNLDNDYLWSDISNLQNAVGVPFFIHIDEVDVLLSVNPPVAPLSISAVERYYRMWELLAPILRIGSSVFCTGRSSLINSIGSGLYRRVGIYLTDGRTQQIILGNLKYESIPNSLEFILFVVEIYRHL